MSTYKNPYRVLDAEITGPGTYLSESTTLNEMGILTWFVQVLGDVEAELVPEVSNAVEPDDAVEGLDRWADESLAVEPTIEPAQRTPDTDVLEFVPFEAESPDITGVATVSTQTLPAYTASGSGVGKTITMDDEGVLTIGGVALAEDDLVLLHPRHCQNPLDAGLYEVTTEGEEAAGEDPAVAAVLTRATDFDQAAECVTGTTIEVDGGDGAGVYVLAAPAFGVQLRTGFKRARLKLVVTDGTGRVIAHDMARVA